jgi:hypothetical protein
MNWSTIKFHLGKIANLLGYPAIVRECDYRSRTIDTFVTVKRRELYTVITVNGVDVYFNRLSGSIDGVGTSRVSGYMSHQAQESEHSEPGAAILPPPQKSRNT